MKKSEIKEMYSMMFAEYPDVLSIKDLQKMLGISRQLAYDLINDGEIAALTIGHSYKIPNNQCIVNLNTRVVTFSQVSFRANGVMSLRTIRRIQRSILRPFTVHRTIFLFFPKLWKEQPKSRQK